MKKNILSLIVLSIVMCSSFALAGPTTEVGLIGGDPIYTESDFSPLVFLNSNGGRVLYNEAYWSGPPGENGDILQRSNNYIFTGEQIQWKVLVWDKNGVPEKLRDTWAGWSEQLNGPVPPEAQVNCEYLGGISENLENKGYPNVRRPGDQEAQTIGNPDTMGEFLCTLTIEPSCHGQKWLGVQSEDLDGNIGTMQHAESWFCNPDLGLDVSGTLSFGDLGPGEQGAATISIENSAEAGSGVQVVLAIAGTDFYDPSSSGALCPNTNALSLQGDQSSFSSGFWYTATMGNQQTVNKRIPYKGSNGVQSADPIFSSSSQANNWRKWSGNLVSMSPGAETSLTMHLGIPQPCNGQFTSGEINLYAWAI